MKLPKRSIYSVLVVLICLTALATQPLAQRRGVTKAAAQELSAPQDHPAPTEVRPGNATCAQLNENNTLYPAVTSSDQLKLDFGSPFSGTYDFRTYTSPDGEVELTGEAPDNRDITTSANGDTLNSFNSDLLITAVIIKAGDNSYTFAFPSPGVFNHGTLDTGQIGVVNDISHVVFCFSTAGPSAADVTVVGRVGTSTGAGIRGATLTATNPFTGEVSYAVTNPFGFYRFDNLESGHVYFITVSHRRHRFQENTKTVTLNDSLADVNFTAVP